ncbi:GNAT family N-acetyltransferase [Undibacterium sp. Jales W-56]|uniref:GNAT family N-acetyltransferase n=1 Tax=Undibacterium sp. Jales W-56 TaxID=2897325 RepID=UPI0021CEB28C|nr:GNAT family N-acetyltransferase [Undibacterium sp. Jales W-56]MCU6433892.1 GNAT family N-acetyltransferase [Undibacterium sp. Jales W-56]
MKLISLNSKTELQSHENAIAALFLDCFGKPISEALWRWAYLDNPHGDPVVSLCYDGDILVGHYAMIPMPLSLQEQRINSYLSITTMVTELQRKAGLFAQLGDLTYQRGLELGIDFVMGFPNALATPGRKKRLQWNIPAPDFVASLKKSELLEKAKETDFFSKKSWRLNLNDEISRCWRLSRPGGDYHWDNGLAYKKFGDSIDLMYFFSINELERLPEDCKINVLVPATADAFRSYWVFDYQFGGRSLRMPFNSEMIMRQMALSDVF